MYQVLGIKSALTYFGLLCVVVMTAWGLFSPPFDLASSWKIASGSVSGCAFAVTLVGQTPLFVWLCRLPLVRSWFPPIEGKWKAELRSNWPAIQQRGDSDGAQVALSAVPATVTIIARLFHIRMNLTSDSRYSSSKTVFIRATRDPEDGSVALHYLYKNLTQEPEKTDSGSHDGAANLSVEWEGSNIWLDGTYWTNRNWRKGLNTAGRITLKRA